MSDSDEKVLTGENDFTLMELQAHARIVDQNLEQEREENEKREAMERFGLTDPSNKGKKAKPADPIVPPAPAATDPNPFAS